MSKEWTDDEVSNEIAEAVRIVREDRFEAFVRGRVPTTDDNNGRKDPPASGGNNPDPNGGPPKKKKSLFWGEEE
jgi:hypothetical protein